MLSAVLMLLATVCLLGGLILWLALRRGLGKSLLWVLEYVILPLFGR